jgi:hypothetical protein
VGLPPSVGEPAENTIWGADAVNTAVVRTAAAIAAASTVAVTTAISSGS